MNTAALDVALGLILMYLVLSLLCTVINEFVATLSRLRAQTLKHSISQLIDYEELKTDFYKHGLINSATLANKNNHVAYLSGQSFAMAILDSLNQEKPVATLSDIEDAIKKLPECNIKDILLVNLSTAGGKLEVLRDNLSAWFDQAMDNVSGLYKHYLKLISLGVGLLLAVSINADTVTVGKALWYDNALREQMVQSAQKFVPDNKSEKSDSPAAIPEIIQSVKDSENQLRPLPVGWDFSSPNWTWSFWYSKIAGLIMTAFALSLGAPFWFDLLSKFVNLRGALKPERTDDN